MFNSIFTSQWVFVTNAISYVDILLAVTRYKISFAKSAAPVRSTPCLPLAAVELEFMQCITYSEVKAIFHGTSTWYTQIIKKYLYMLLSFPCGRQGASLQCRQHHLSASSSTWNSAFTQWEGKMKLAAYLLRVFIKPHTEQEMLPQNNTILCEAVLKIPFRENEKCVHIYTCTFRKNILPAVLQGAEEKWGNIFVARPTARTYMTCINVVGTGYDLEL